MKHFFGNMIAYVIVKWTSKSQTFAYCLPCNVGTFKSYVGWHQNIIGQIMFIQKKKIIIIEFNWIAIEGSQQSRVYYII